jgi:cyclase
MVLDIDATGENREPDYKMIEHLAAECRMPLCYGGGIKSAAQAQRIFNLGVEKIAISAAVINNESLLKEIADIVGVQSVVVVLDVKKKLLGGYEVYINNGRKGTGKNPIQFAKHLQDLGVGEIVINSIDQDGQMKGYDMNLIQKIREVLHIPLTVLGGAGSLDDIKSVIDKFGVLGVSAGSLFVFKGVYKAVLINYPTRSEKEKLFINVT